MVGIMFSDNSLNGLDTDTRAFTTWALEGDDPSGYFPDSYGVVVQAIDEESGFGPFDTYDEACQAAIDLFHEGAEGLICVTEPGTGDWSFVLDVAGNV